MLLRFSVLIIYFIMCTLSSEGMTIVKQHGHLNRGEKLLRSDAVRKIYIDPAPPVDMRRKRRTTDKDIKITPVSNAEKAVQSQAQTIEKTAEEELADFLLKNGLALSAVDTTVPNTRLEVTIKPLEESEVTKESTPASLVGKRQNSNNNLQIPDLRTSNDQKDALSYDVVENLVLSIKKNSLLDVSFIVEDLKKKLDMVLDKNSPGMRQNERPAKPQKPKKQNLIKEMDKIMDSFLRTSQNASSSESSSAESDSPPPQDPVMRSHDEEQLKDDEEEDLEFDLEGDNAPHDKLRFELKVK